MIKIYIDNFVKKLSKNWKLVIEVVLDIYLGKNLNNFIFEGKSYMFILFRDMLKINVEDYVIIISFIYVLFYLEFILNILDNWSYGSMYNVLLDEMMVFIDKVLESGFMVELDCDVSEKIFFLKDGVVVIFVDFDNNIKVL